MKEVTCEYCNEKFNSDDNHGTSKEPCCCICWDDLHKYEPDEFSDADNGL